MAVTRQEFNDSLTKRNGLVVHWVPRRNPVDPARWTAPCGRRRPRFASDQLSDVTCAKCTQAAKKPSPATSRA